jgi:tRNA G18 (ribose-2'-O)-methylase SpoU
MNNVGAVFRTSDAFKVDQISLCGVTAQPPHRDIQKTALGATESVDWVYYENTLDAITVCKKDGFQVVSIEQAENSIMLNEFQVDSTDKIAIVMGNEVHGVDQDVINASDFVVEIPQFGTKHSLNISVCTGVVVWDLFSKMNFKN